MARKILFCVLVALIVSGCARSRAVRDENGWQNYVISCGGPMLSMGHCQEKAGAICRGYGYTIIGKKGGEPLATGNDIPSGGDPVVPASLSDFQTRELYIRCNF